MILFKITLVSIFLYFFLLNILSVIIGKDLPFFKNQNLFIMKSRFFSSFGLFLGMDHKFHDIKIVANGTKTEEIWYLRRDRKIGNLDLKPHMIRQALAFNYSSHEYDKFMNIFFKDKIEEYFLNKNEKLLSLKIFVGIYSSYEDDFLLKNYLKPIEERNIFNWEQDIELVRFI